MQKFSILTLLFVRKHAAYAQKNVVNMIMTIARLVQLLAADANKPVMSIMDNSKWHSTLISKTVWG
ncbi:hypothetical protein A3860_39100 [Niastella vici]|uniref:Uncharacterized protein n=1 Tax=Niastella vici TaxID=1703345 RepID=A0A1V9FKN2_9BACT|nr:hypothetical protein A3860_39100 [Niastella vici]